MPATTLILESAAMRRTPSAQGPSTGSATGPSGTPNRHMVASGNTTSFAPAAAAWRLYSATNCRFAVGSVPLRICANAIRMSASLGPVAGHPVAVEISHRLGDPLRGEALFGGDQFGQPGADEVLQLAADDRDAHLHCGAKGQPAAAGPFDRLQDGGAGQVHRRIHDGTRDRPR